MSPAMPPSDALCVFHPRILGATRCYTHNASIQRTAGRPIGWRCDVSGNLVHELSEPGLRGRLPPGLRAGAEHPAEIQAAAHVAAVMTWRASGYHPDLDPCAKLDCDFVGGWVMGLHNLARDNMSTSALAGWLASIAIFEVA